MSKVIVVGGGIIGLCSAYYLNKAGHEVTVIDRGSINEGTSFGNAGYISPSHFIPLASPGIVAKGLKWMLSSTSPFYIKPRLDLDLIKWGLTFWKRSARSVMEKNILPLNQLLQTSRALTSDIKNDLGNTFLMQEVGCLMLYKSLDTEKHEIELCAEANALGIETKVYDAKGIQDLEPQVEVNVRGGVLYPIDAHLSPSDWMKTLHSKLEARGVRFLLQTEVVGFEKKGNNIDAVLTESDKYTCNELVLAAGSWLPVVSKELGVEILLQAGKGYSMTFSEMIKNLKHPSILVDDRVAMTPMGNQLRLGGTMEISGLNSPMLVKRAEAIFKAVKNYYPDLSITFPGKEKIWSGLRPLSPDGLPYIGRHSKYANLIIAGGHAMLGISLAAASGKLIEEIVSNTPTFMDIKPFNPERY